jgi:ankyrin repeat protein
MHSLDEVLDKHGNTPLHYCALFTRRAILEQVLATADEGGQQGGGWERLVVKANLHQLTPVDLALQQQATGEGVEVAQVRTLCPPL